MTQRLIYGKTVKIQGDSIIIDTPNLTLDVDALDLEGPMTMDPFDPTGLIPPIRFRKTARQTLSIPISGLAAAKNIKVEATRNDDLITLVFPSDVNLTFTPTGGSFTFVIPAPYTSVNSSLNYSFFAIRNLTTSSEQEIGFNINPFTGLVTITTITGGQNYDLRYGMPTMTYRAI